LEANISIRTKKYLSQLKITEIEKEKRPGSEMGPKEERNSLIKSSGSSENRDGSLPLSSA